MLFWSIHAGSLPSASGVELARDSFDRWGFINDRPVVGDWDRDGRDNAGVVREDAVQELDEFFLVRSTQLTNAVLDLVGLRPVGHPACGCRIGCSRDSISGRSAVSNIRSGGPEG